MNISLVQMVSSRDRDTNLVAADRLITEAAKSSDYIFLPENFAALAADSPSEVGQAETNSEGPVRSFLSDIASRLSLWIFAGTFPLAVRPDGTEIEDGRVRAASLVVDPNGREACRYDKIHMFDADVTDNQRRYRESAVFEPGSDVVSVDCPLGKVGLSVCYDLRFPELYRRLFEEEVDVITAPSAFTEVTGKAHFELLMRSRAVENTCFMVGACQGGVHDSGRRTWGHSMVVDPWGVVLDQLDHGEGILTVNVDMNERRRIRSEMPFHKQRRL